MRIALHAAAALALLATPAGAEPPAQANRTLGLYGDIGLGLGVGGATGEDGEGRHVDQLGPGIAFQAGVGLELARPRGSSFRLGGFVMAGLGGMSGIMGGGEGELAWPVRRRVRLGVRLAAGYGAWEPIEGVEGLVGGIAGLRLRDDSSWVGVDAIGFGNSFGKGGGLVALAGLGGRPGKLIVGTTTAIVATIFLVFVLGQESDNGE